MSKILNIKDRFNLNDNIILPNDKGGPKGTRILFVDDVTGEVYREEHNKQVLAGSQRTAMRQFGLDELVKLPNYNAELGIDTSQSYDDGDTAYLFCCGNSGCGTDAAQVYPVKYASRMHPDSVIPFRYQNMDDDLSAAQREIYFGRKEVAEDDRIAYYYKAFDSKPQMHINFVDGTQIGSDIYEIASELRAVCYVETRLKITKSDFRDWYLVKDRIGNCRINTLSILTAHPREGEDGFIYYDNVQPLTMANFTNEWLIDLTKSITILYQIFY